MVPSSHIFSGGRLKLILTLAIIAFISVIVFLTSATKAAPSASTLAPLQPIKIFTDSPHGQWNGSGNGTSISLDSYGNLPIDSGGAHSYNGLPSYRLEVDFGGSENYAGWWLSILAGSSWESYSIEPYYPNGFLEFNIKGTQGGEDFKIALSDVVFERNPKWCEPVSLNISSYVNVTTSFQHVAIPLTDLVGDFSCEPKTNEYLDYAGGTFDLTQIYSIVLSHSSTADVTVWLNDIEWTSPDNEPEFAPIKVNQLGFTPNAPKYALVSGYADVLSADVTTPFHVRRVGDNASVYEGNLVLLSAEDAASGEKVFKGDFSAVTQAGDYYISINGVQNSAPFSIGVSVYDSLVVDSARYFYYQRQGIDLPATYAGTFDHGLGHPQDAYVPRESDPANPNDPNDPNNPNNPYTRDVMKGWYDAGDYGKYVNAGATAISDLLWAYELFPNQFPDNHLNIPESGNGVPDILDEVRWELEWMLKMQDTDGGFYHMVKSKGGDGRSQWDSDTTPDISPDQRFIRDNDVAGYGTRTNVKPTSVTGDAVAALAHAAVVYAPYDATFADEMLQAAIDGWGYLQANQNYIQPIIGAPYTIPYVDFENPGPGDPAPDVDDRVWAAAALYRATDDTQYRTYFDNNYQDLNTTFGATDENAYGPGLVSIPAVLTYFAADNQTPSVLTDLTNQFNGWRDHMLARSNTSVWQTTLLNEDYYWGSNYPNLTTPLALAVGTAYLGSYNQDIVNLSRKSFNYTLGTNPLQFSYVTGYGENALERPFSQIYNFDNKPGVPPGMLAGGANEYNNSFLYSAFPAKSYQDNAAAWSTNEHTVYWNAVIVFHAALAAHEASGGTPPTPTPTPGPNATATPTPTNTPTATPPPTNTPMPTPTPDPGSVVDNVAYDEVLLAGSQTNDYQATWEDDFVLEVICERQTNGNPSQRYDYVDHTWLFNIVASDLITFYATVWETSVNPQDEFEFAYSTDNVNFTPMFVVGDGRSEHSYVLPADTAGTLYVKVTDSDQTPGNRDVECVNVEQMFVRSESNSTPTAVGVSQQGSYGYVSWLAAVLGGMVLLTVALAERQRRLAVRKTPTQP